MRFTPRRTKPAVRALLWLALALYAAVLVYIVFFARRRSILVWSPNMVNLMPLIGTIRDHRNIDDIGWWNYWSNIFGNIVLFLPLPTLLAGVTGLRSRRVLFGCGVAVSVLIETLQYVFHVGVTDIDDVIFNSIGAGLGLVVWELLFRKIMRWLAYQHDEGN
ncbi:VanZ family protein [Hymenobacter nivis]|nr:VanZ family protein [Hymenobacter nivis]